MPSATQPIGQSLFDFLSEGKQNGKNVYETSSMPQRTEDLHATIAYPQGQLNKLTVGEGATSTAAFTGVEPAAAFASDAVVLGAKNTPAGKPDLVGPSKSTVVTAPAELTAPLAGLTDLTPSTSATTDQIFKSHKGKG